MAKYTPYPKYKDSGIAWIGDVPEGWDVKPLFALANESKVSNKGMIEDNLLSLSYGNIVRRNIHANEGLLPESFETYQIVEENNIVFRLTDLQNDQRSLRSAIVTERGIITSAYLAIIMNKNCNSSFYNYLFRSYDVLKVFYAMGAGLRQSLKYIDLKHLQLISPCSITQQAIATFLDRETAHIDKLISKKSRSIELLKEKRQATITQAVTKGLNPNVPMKDSGIEWIGDIPEEWRTLRVKNLSQKIKTGATPDIFAEERDNFISWYTPSNFTDSFELTENCKKVSPNTPKVITFQPETILVIGIGATLGKVALTQVPCFANQQINFIVPNKSKILPIFLTFALSSQLCQMKFVSNSSTLGIMNQEKTANIVICCPPLHKQQSIVDYLDVQCTKIDDLITKTESSIELLKEKRQALIAAAVTGKIDVREAVC